MCGALTVGSEGVDVSRRAFGLGVGAGHSPGLVGGVLEQPAARRGGGEGRLLDDGLGGGGAVEQPQSPDALVRGAEGAAVRVPRVLRGIIRVEPIAVKVQLPGHANVRAAIADIVETLRHITA